MRLDEFKRTMEMPKDIPNANPLSMDFIKYLKDNGWRGIGSGYFSLVYANPNYPYVMKVTKKYDRGFAKFAMLTHQHPNKHFPVIGNAKLIKTGMSKYHVYLIEKLFPLEERYEECVSMLSSIIDVVDNPTPENVNSHIANIIKRNIKFLRDNDRDAEYMEDFYDQWQEFMKENGSVIEAMLIVLKYRDGALDFAPRNFMQRKDGTIVITDPVAGL